MPHIKPNPKKKSGRNALIFAAVTVFFGCAFYNGLTVRTYTLKTDKVNRAVRLALLTDLHSCLYGRNQIDLIEKIKAQNPDAIAMSGDIADNYMPREGTTALLKGLKGMYPSFYVAGNHEIRRRDSDKFKAELRGYGVTVLEGDRVVFTANGQAITICGVDDPAIGAGAFRAQLGNAFAENDGNYTVLLSHRPERIGQYAALDCDLVLCGHAHGGQWRVPFVLNGIIAPNQGLFPKYAGGLYEQNGTTMIVSRGLAKESTPFIPRVFNPPEVVIVDIVPAG